MDDSIRKGCSNGSRRARSTRTQSPTGSGVGRAGDVTAILASLSPFVVVMVALQYGLGRPRTSRSPGEDESTRVRRANVHPAGHPQGWRVVGR